MGLYHELLYEYRFNTIHMLLCLLFLLPAGALGHGFQLSAESSNKNTWSQFLIVLLTVDVYLNSAWHKVRSKHFISGVYLRQLTLAASELKSSMPLWEYRHPTVLATLARSGSHPAIWPLAAVGTVALESVVPIGLFISPLRPFAVLLGVGMHIVFMGILPVRLLPFTLASISTYVLFV